MLYTCWSVIKSIFNPMDCSRPGFIVLHHLLEFAHIHMSIESVMPSNHLILCCPLLLLSVFPGIRVFTYESPLHIRWPKSWSFSFSISPSNEYSGLISFRIDWFDLLAVQGLSRIFSSTKVWKHQFLFMVQLSHTYMTTGKTIALCIWTLLEKLMSLLFNMLSSFVIASLPRS